MAQKPPLSKEIIDFCHTLASELKPWAEREGMGIDVQSVDLPGGSPWKVVRVHPASKCRSDYISTADNWPAVLKIADNLATTEIIHPDPDSNTLMMARLDQARYWSRSQARLAARRIIWEYSDTLFGSETE